MNDFEQFLKRRHVPAVPVQWRGTILAAAHAAEKTGAKEAPERPWWIAWLWPSPVAWAGIACAWVLALGMNAMSTLLGEGTPSIVAVAPQSMPVYTMMMHERWLTWELFQEERGLATPPPPPPRDPSGAWNKRRKQPQTVTA